MSTRHVRAKATSKQSRAKVSPAEHQHNAAQHTYHSCESKLSGKKKKLSAA